MKKFISIVLSVFIVLSSILFSVASVSGNQTTRYIVLVLDTSGTQKFYSGDSLIYTADSAVSYVKQASTKFVGDVLNAKGNNKIAVVEYNSSAYVVSDFSDNAKTINNKINGLSSSSSGSCIAAGLEKAEQLLSQITDANADKNIVLVTTGFTNVGQYNYTGHYDSNTIGSNWQNRNTNVKLYAYTNVAYSTAERIKNNATIYTLGLFQTMEGMPELGKNIAAFFKLAASDLASSPDHFYEVEDPSKLAVIFGDITEKLINPLGISLSHTLTNEILSVKNDAVTTTYYDHYLYTITAQISNTADTTAKNVICTLELPPEAVPFSEMISPAPKKEISIGDIPAGGRKNVSWNIEIKWPEEDIAPIYGVHAKADNTVDMYQTNIIYVSSKRKNNNAFVFGTDQWSFSNSDDFFKPNGNETYYITDDDYAGLVYKLSNTEKDNIDAMLAMSWGGSCYGMSATAILTKMGVYEPGEIQAGKSTLYSISKTNNDDVESFINYYQATQYLDPVVNERTQFNLLSNAEKIERIESQAMDVANGASPFILSISFTDSGHAMVAYGHETGSWKFGGFLGFGAKEYDSRILVYDCNHPNDKDGSCLYYNSGTTDWYMPNYDFINITRANADIEIMDCKNYEVNTTNQQAYIKSENLTRYAIIIDNKSYEITPETFDKELGMTTYFVDKGSNTPSEMIAVLPTFTKECMVSVEDKSDFGLSLNYGNLSLSADVQSADKIGFKPNGTVFLEENNGEFELALVANEGHRTTPWYKTTISGDEANDIKMEQKKEGVLIDGDKLSNIKIATKDGKEEKTQIITTNKKGVLLTADAKNNPIVMIDSDGDGKYDEQLHTYSLNVKATKGGEITSQTDWQLSRKASVELKAEPAKGYVFSGWTSSNGGKFEDAKSLNTEFTMPDGDTVVTAHFRKATIFDKILSYIESIPRMIFNWLRNFIADFFGLFNKFF